MAINIATIEARIREEFPCSEGDIHRIIYEVRESISAHILCHRLRPHDLFQMRLIQQEEMGRSIPPSQQTHLVVYFGNTSLQESYLDALRSYYGRVIYLHLRLNHSIIL